LVDKEVANIGYEPPYSLVIIESIKAELTQLGDPETAGFLQRFFKTGVGEYGEGDLFRGIRVPILRKLAIKYQLLDLKEIKELLHSAYHEDRLLALLILVRLFQRGDESIRSKIYKLYLDNVQYINNWDLVDTSAVPIVGHYLWDKDRRPLYQLAESNDIWKRRISIMSTFFFIKNGDFVDTLNLAKILLKDKEDLIHKAVGWMLREVGNRDIKVEEAFLKNHYQQMPRTMLRYAIEKFPQELRKQYLSGQV
jgi:3-methyladenine DNA glycosylase AlkD